MYAYLTKVYFIFSYAIHIIIDHQKDYTPNLKRTTE